MMTLNFTCKNCDQLVDVVTADTTAPCPKCGDLIVLVPTKETADEKTAVKKKTKPKE